MTSPPFRPVRIGAVSYLNSKPLIEGLDRFAPQAELILDVPSRLADDLAAGRLDVALVPSIECLLHPEYEIVSDACVATHGPVFSVKLYSRVPMGDIRTLALDDGSRTSAVLARIMLAERFGVEPELCPLPLGCTTADAPTDAVLLIGDRAMHAPTETFAEIRDLGEEWSAWSGLPFVFAHWAARPEVELEDVTAALTQARDLGISRLDQIANREAAALGISVETATDYLRHNLHFTLGSAEQSGLNLYYELAGNLGIGPVETMEGDDLDLAYRQMAADEVRESAALEWCESTVGDVAEESH